MQGSDQSADVAESRDSFIVWLANFTLVSCHPDTAVDR